MAHVKFPHRDVKENMTALNTPWIYYGVRDLVHGSSRALNVAFCRDLMQVLELRI